MIIQFFKEMKMTTEKIASRGRPLKSHEDKAAKKILMTARSLFVEKGFAATSISDIAKKAGISQSLIYHHFDNKQNLWKLTKNHVLAEYGKFEPFMVKPETSLHEFVAHIINQRAALYENNPDLARMMLWQRLENSSQSLVGGNEASPDLWKEMIQVLQKHGKIRSDLDPDMIITLIINLVTGIYLYPTPLFEKLEKRNTYIKMVIDFLERGLSGSNPRIMIY